VQFVASLLALRLSQAPQLLRAELEWWLDITSNTIAYRTRYLDRAGLADVLHLLIRDEHNPRGLSFQCTDIRAMLAQMTAGTRIVPEESFDTAVTAVAEADFGVLEGAGYNAVAARQGFAQQLTALADAATQLSDKLSMRHFSHTEGDLHVVAA
jgi:uncharacterized alpha-E superfamily protein